VRLLADDVGERGDRPVNQGSVTIRTDVQAAINFGELNGEAAAPQDRGGTTGATDYPIVCSPTDKLTEIQEGPVYLSAASQVGRCCATNTLTEDTGDFVQIGSSTCDCIRRRRSNHRLTVRINRFRLGLKRSIHGGGRRCRG
jgi:hypothetical protein